MAIKRDIIKAGEYEWFYREANPQGHSDRLPIVFLHGLIAPSYSWREVMPGMAEVGFRSIAPDWIGTGNSQIPERLDFPYTAEALTQELGQFLDALELDQFSLVVQGYSGAFGLKYALEHKDRIERLAILNAPISGQDKLPFKISQLGIPLIGDALVQDFRLPDKILEGGGGYRVEDKDMNVYRNPWLDSSDGGRALHAMIRNLKLPQLGADIEQGLKTWRKPLLLAWGDRDPWLPVAKAQATAKAFPGAEFIALEEVGHYPQEDWHEKVIEALSVFLRRSV
ncbi:alpha/beta fold hydrolase [filamentous cyanobacterium LEGE 11480]|uniref:Alpha/beta fold hydrolase n=1 Tax=Romeriopsis navalis LEGE 11480 TaxID=2777977 RepID=A0A928Z6E9_9CYAN|nr:alpha/beta fold hydrolase [Romeriopsis navalis]MBE9032165.1 alpha/beta fold hydrolase [Romeriopsis navalis LEGE 11480]